MKLQSKRPSQKDLYQRNERRISRKAAKLGCQNMNDTKWDEVFRVLLEQGLESITFRMKLVDCDEIFLEKHLWRVTRKWTDSPSGPFQNREIEWVEIAGKGAVDIWTKLKPLGQLPTVEVNGGFRVIAYGPIIIS